jgi:hypothetical protein
MSKLIIDFQRGYDEMLLIKDFPVDNLQVRYEQRGALLKYWRATLSMENDVLDERQYEWILKNIDFIKCAVFETNSVGLVSRRGSLGEAVPFRMAMRRR